jgi:hypothetical protein
MKSFGCTLAVFFILLGGTASSLAQRIVVESAYYGTPDRSRNVARRVQRFADYGEPFRVSNDTFRMDPAPGQRKALTVVYSVGDRRTSDKVQEGSVFYFRGGRYADTGPGYYRRGIQVLNATYGARGRYASVTRAVQNFVRNRQTFTVSNHSLGIDPYPGVKKHLRVVYFRQGVRRIQLYAEGEVVRL